jgi:hypothetical protein
MKVSVVISGYNEKDAIEKIVGAVGNAPLADREIIVEGTLVCRLAPAPQNFLWHTWWHFSTQFFTQFLAVMGFTTTANLTHQQHRLGRAYTLFTIVGRR